MRGLVFAAVLAAEGGEDDGRALGDGPPRVPSKTTTAAAAEGRGGRQSG